MNKIFSKNNSATEIKVRSKCNRTEIKSMRYLGAEPWSTLKVIKRILNSIRGRIGNQGRC